MKKIMMKLYAKLEIVMQESGQDLVEYALVVALIAFAAATGMKSLATALNTAFATIGNTLSTYTS